MNFMNAIGLGVAGNFAGHLEQAGEAKDFANVATQDVIQPKAIFPFYVPQANNFLATYPLSADYIRFPRQGADNLQIEPEVALICDIQYSQQKVTALIPRAFAAYNDCSIRCPNANKICEKKNWGEQTKGIATNLISLTSFDQQSEINTYRIACFHQRGTALNEYGVDSPVLSYSYFHQKLLDWIIDRMNHQPDQGPMNEIYSLIQQANYPTQAVISIGATRYTPFGEKNFLQVGDSSIVVLYPGDRYSSTDIKQMIQQQRFPTEVSALVQKVID
ncbi:hypothetical protein EV694_0930 [Volucribacter psittacicida]|uniref:Uncharacterized protein n=1 Tax=Volucribacter psittacicida TaxID=203482 RepID=A0A4R1FXK9_9PAST|nr:DUF5718 family protein [Volucribacter psittacicida]TCJ98522.1 hypothetical protein EV694_0930 [Volucribacter psittacicida]